MISKLKQYKKQFLILILFIAIVTGAGIYFLRPVNTTLTLYGNVDVREVSLSFNSSERISQMNAEEGDIIHKGDVLAVLNTVPLELSIARCKTQLAQQQAVVDKMHNGSRPEEIQETEAAVQSAEAAADNAVADYTRMQTLYNGDAISKQALDNAEARAKAAVAALNRARATHRMSDIGFRREDIDAAEAQLESLRVQLENAEYNLAQATLIAPEDGVIRSRLLEPGDMASPAVPVYTLSLNTKKWVRAYISEDNLFRIHEGQAAKVTIDGVSSPIDGQVGYISGTAEFTPKTVQTTELRTALMYEVRIYVDDPDNLLRLGMPATVTF